MGQLPLHMAAGTDHFRLVPKTLPQIAEICHEDDLVSEVLSGADIFQGIQCGNITLQRIIRQVRQALQLAHARHTQQHFKGGAVHIYREQPVVLHGPVAFGVQIRVEAGVVPI